jgi:hypothetical protein
MIGSRKERDIVQPSRIRSSQKPLPVKISLFTKISTARTTTVG